MTDIDLSQYPQTVKAFGGNDQRAKVFLDRYARKGEEGRPVESNPAEMWNRVALAIADNPDQAGRFGRLLEDFKFVPGGRILAGAGVDAEVTFYNCYVIPVETRGRRHNRAAAEVGGERFDPTVHTVWESDPGNDSREAIFDTIGLMVDIMSRGGGVGINWSVLRPKGAYLKRVNGTTSGPVSWMDVASRAVGVVEQGGSRRGAAMFMLDDWHPDVLEFIDAKRDFSLITNANVSVAVSDEFMTAVRLDGDWQFEFPDTSHAAYNSEWDGDIAGWAAKGYPVKTYGTIRARDLWRKLSEAAWASGEPGIVFLDRYNKLSVANHAQGGAASIERIISVNPCGEQGLGPYSVCNLGAMNLAAYVLDTVGYSPSGKSFDWDRFTRDVSDAVEFLDQVIDKNYYFIPENERIQKTLRRIGLGVMGLADTLIALGLRYGDPDAVKFTDMVFRTMRQAAVSRSAFLAQEKGAAPGWDISMVNAPYFIEFADTPLGDQIARYGVRNLYLLTQAPTGTTSILAGVNSGIEPYFAFEYTRKDRTGTHRVETPVVKAFREAGGMDDTWDTSLPAHFVTSGDVTVEEHIAMQAAVQRHIDSSVSKTINGPTGHTVDDVERAYTLAYESGLKGIAYFRDGSGRDQVLYKDEPKAKVFSHIDWCQSTGDYGAKDCDCPETEREGVLLRKYEELQQQLAELAPHAVVYKRPEALHGTTIKVRTSAGTAYVTVNADENGKPVELFVNVGKAGSDIMELGEAIGRMASLALRNGSDLGSVALQLVGIGGNGKFNPPLAHAIGVALLEVNLDNEERSGGGYGPILTPEEEDDVVASIPLSVTHDVKTMKPLASSGQMCPDCHNFTVALEEGCKKCMSCGWSAC